MWLQLVWHAAKLGLSTSNATRLSFRISSKFAAEPFGPKSIGRTYRSASLPGVQRDRHSQRTYSPTEPYPRGAPMDCRHAIRNTGNRSGEIN